MDVSGKWLVEGEDFYFDQKGLFVFTEKYHLAKGYCCGNGCLHCPYEYINVPEPERTKLIRSRSADR